MVTMIVLVVNRRGAHGGRGKANAMINQTSYCQELSFGDIRRGLPVQYRVVTGREGECVWRWFRGRDNNHYPTRLVNTHTDKSVGKEESIFPQHTVLYSNCHQLKITGGKFFLLR